MHAPAAAVANALLYIMVVFIEESATFCVYATQLRTLKGMAVHMHLVTRLQVSQWPQKGLMYVMECRCAKV